MPKATMTWDADTDRKLLMAIIKTSNVTINYEDVSKELTTEAVPCTVIAVKKRMAKLKAMCSGKPAKASKRPASGDDDDDEEGDTKKRTKTSGEASPAIKKYDEDDEIGAVKNEDNYD